jgi:hypothetical protein
MKTIKNFINIKNYKMHLLNTILYFQIEDNNFKLERERELKFTLPLMRVSSIL